MLTKLTEQDVFIEMFNNVIRRLMANKVDHEYYQKRKEQLKGKGSHEAHDERTLCEQRVKGLAIQIVQDELYIEIIGGKINIKED